MIRLLLKFAEAAVLWVTYEAPRILWAHLTPGLRTKSHITETIVGNDAPLKSKVAVIVLFPENGIANDLVSLTRALTDADCSVVLVSNKALTPQSMERLAGAYHTLHIRTNVGRDFGAYKDAVVRLLDHPGLERLVLLNDSCHYIADNIAGFVAGLLGPQDMIGSHENFDPPYHLGSFALSFSGKVVRSPSFRHYWTDYLPVNTRRWAILRGEMGVSRAAILTGCKPHVIYSPERLYEALLAAPQKDVEDALTLLPRSSASRTAMDIAMRANLASERAAGLAGFTKTRLVEAIVHAVCQGSQVHTGAFLYARFLGSPLVKKDLLFRGVYNADQLYMASLRVPLSNDILEAYRTRSSSPRGGWFTRRLRARGLV